MSCNIPYIISNPGMWAHVSRSPPLEGRGRERAACVMCLPSAFDMRNLEPTRGWMMRPRPNERRLPFILPILPSALPSCRDNKRGSGDDDDIDNEPPSLPASALKVAHVFCEPQPRFSPVSERERPLGHDQCQGNVPVRRNRVMSGESNGNRCNGSRRIRSHSPFPAGLVVLSPFFYCRINLNNKMLYRATTRAKDRSCMSFFSGIINRGLSVFGYRA